MNQNARYLINPNRLSTRVHYAPGGASSLSLGWDNTPTVRPEKQKYPQNGYYKQQTQPIQNYPSTANQRQQEYKQTPNYQPMNQPHQNPIVNDPNRILEQQLQYYQNRNKQVQNNIYGGYENPNQMNDYAKKQQQQQYMQPNQYTNKPQEQGSYGYGQNYPQQIGKYEKHADELDIALHQHRQRQESISSSNKYGQYTPQNQEKTSVRVNNPPGGRSNIIFG